ncbi:conserved protein of unknown function [Methanocaldococcus lauensis]|nr:conserved protein of unknown function [Methanocaldococcus lauensis]
MVLNKSKIEVIEQFIYILEILDMYAKEGSDEKAIIRLMLDYLEKGNVLDEDILPISNKILEIAKKVGSYDLKREINLWLFGKKKKLTKSQKNKIKKLIEILEYLKNYIEKKPYKSYEDTHLLNLIYLKILRLDENIVSDYNSEVRSLLNIAFRAGDYELKNEIELLLTGRKRRKLTEEFIQKRITIIEILEKVKEFIEKKEFKSSFDYEALFLINLKIYRIEHGILKSYDEEIDSILKIARKVGNYKLREEIILLKESIKN